MKIITIRKRKLGVNTANVMMVLLVSMALISCASVPDEDTSGSSTAQSEAAANTEEQTTQTADATASKSASPVMAAPDPLNEPQLEEPVRIVQSCKKEPFVKYEINARDGINKAWEDTQAGRFGYGFRGTAEYKKWKATHKKLFTETASNCRTLTKCAREAGKDAESQCLDQARTFAGWQEVSKHFLAKVKTMEIGQAPNLCTITPDAADLSECYDRLADRIDRSCNDENCVEISQCWRGVAYLDQAIRQAESSCGFVHEPLNKCRSYTGATSRRTKKFNQCQSMQKEAGLDLLPVL